MTLIATNPSEKLTAALRPSGLPHFPIVSSIVAAWKESANARKLRRLSPHLLQDIGLSDTDITLLKSTQLKVW